MKLLNKLSETITKKTMESLNNDIKVAEEQLVKFNGSVTLAVKNFTSKNPIDDNEETKLPNLENYLVIFKNKVTNVHNSVVDISNSSKIDDDYINLHNKHIDTIKYKIANETEMFKDFLNKTSVPRDCAIFKFQNKITNLLTAFEQSLPTFFNNIVKAQNSQLKGWKEWLEGRNSSIVASFNGCLEAEDVECCVNDFVSV